MKYKNILDKNYIEIGVFYMLLEQSITILTILMELVNKLKNLLEFF